jgi:hypothetical protein
MLVTKVVLGISSLKIEEDDARRRTTISNNATATTDSDA